RTFIELAAGIQVGHFEHDVTAPDDVKGRIEDVLRNRHQIYSTFKASWMLLRFQLVSLSLICMSNDSANLLCANTGSRWADRTLKICSPAFLRVKRSRPSPSRSTMSRKPCFGLPSAMA